MDLTNKINKWWIPVLTGFALIGTSIFFFTQPVNTFLGLAILFGWLIFATGGMNMVFAIQNRHFFDGWVWYLMIGLFELLIGIALLFQPQLSAESLILFTGFWLIFTAISRISFSLILKKMKINNWWVTFISAIITILLSFLIIINPIFGMISIVYLIAFPIFISGIMAILFGFQLKKLNTLI